MGLCEVGGVLRRSHRNATLQSLPPNSYFIASTSWSWWSLWFKSKLRRPGAILFHHEDHSAAVRPSTKIGAQPALCLMLSWFVFGLLPSAELAPSSAGGPNNPGLASLQKPRKLGFCRAIPGPVLLSHENSSNNNVTAQHVYRSRALRKPYRLLNQPPQGVSFRRKPGVTTSNCSGN